MNSGSCGWIPGAEGQQPLGGEQQGPGFCSHVERKGQRARGILEADPSPVQPPDENAARLPS